MSDKVLLVANTSWYLYNFRLPLARYLRENGYEVVFVAPRDAYSNRLEAESFRFIDFPLQRRNLNPLLELVALYRLWAIYRKESPSVCHHFTIKCVLYGTIAAKLAGVKAVVNAITGLGHAFIGSGWLHRLVRPFLRVLYRLILTARRVQVVFQNGDDFQDFRDRKMVIPDKTTIIRGSGVCLQRFAPRPGGPDVEPGPTVLFASRLIREKGVAEYVEAAQILKSKGWEVRFAMAGAIDPGNPSSFDQATVESWYRQGIVDYLGQIERIEEILQDSTIVVLPSYREGTPRILLEAAASGKPIVATDVPGCREVVRHRFNGLLVPPRNAGALAAAIEELLESPDKMHQFGRNGRELSKEFEESQVIQATVQVYRKARGQRQSNLGS